MRTFKNTTFDRSGRHEFFINSDEGLLENAKRIPIVREYIKTLPDTAATFKLKQIDDLENGHVHNLFMEFIGSWALPDHRELKETRYVNPNYAHASNYSDMIVMCDCGALLNHNYENETQRVDNEHNHTESCQSFQRMRARADMAEARYKEIQRLSWLGWKGVDIGPRFGMTRSNVGSVARDFGLSLQELYHDYQASAGKTYHYLVREQGNSAQTIADIYGHTPSTLGRWADEYVEETTTPSGVDNAIEISP